MSSLERKILSEIERYRSINKYIMEQDAPGALPPEDIAAAFPATPPPPPGGGAGAPPPPADAAATPPPPPQKIDVDSDPDVEKVDDEGKSEKKSSDEESGNEELDITDLVDSQKNIETKQEEYFENLFGQISKLESKLSEMDSIMNKLNALETKIEKYRQKTPEEKLELRAFDSYPFNQKLSQFFDDKKDEMEKTGKNDYVLTADEVEDINVNDIKNSFQPNANLGDEENEFKR
jgi:hypothetical protein